MMNIARLSEFEPADRQRSILFLAWQAREYLSDAEHKEEVSFVVRAHWCEQASTALEAARSLLTCEELPAVVALDLVTRACSAAKAAAANGNIADRYHASIGRSSIAGAHTIRATTRQPSEWDKQHAPKAISIFKRAAETARQETHRALVELCELFPNAMPSEERA